MATKRQDKRRRTRQQTHGLVSTEVDSADAVTTKQPPILESLPSSSRWDRDMIFGAGAVICAVLALVGLVNIASLALLAGFAYAAMAFIRPTERRERWLLIGSWAFVVAAVFKEVFPPVALLTIVDSETLATADLIDGLLPLRALVAISAIGGVALTASTVFIAQAFKRSGPERYRLLSRAGIGIAVFFLMDLPIVVSGTASWPGHEYLWDTPLTYGNTVLGVLAGLILSRAFAWYGASGDGSPSISRASREYLLHVAAASLLLPLLIQLGLTDWRLPFLDPTVEQASRPYFSYVATAAYLLIMPVAFAFLSGGFHAAGRRAGWKPGHWMHPARTWGRRLLLTWRLPLAWSWLLVLMATTTIAGYYGFLAVTPAMIHYLSMLWWERTHSRRPSNSDVC